MGEVSVRGLYIEQIFPDEKHLLDTAYDDFKQFCKVFGIDGKRFPVRVVKEETPSFVAYSISVCEEGCVISSADTEGVRRALIYLEDELQRREGAFLPIGEICRRPRIRTRITRGFFSPTGRPPKNIDELFDDVDYYPEEYLNRLAHDGSNGIFIYTHFRDLIPSDCFPEYGINSEKRIKKLKRITDQCARYGIKIYIHGIEPASLSNEMAARYPEITGAERWGEHAFCTRSELGRKYCIEATQKLCELIPNLGGFIFITNGERFTSCASATAEVVGSCPRCSAYTVGETLAYTVNLFEEGIRRAGSSAECISWTYGHCYWDDGDIGDIKDYIQNASPRVMMAQNFEDNGYVEQLGKIRQARDYWLSYAGPSDMFRLTAETAAQTNKHCFAKMQVCCSHECASVPYIPVPGILFDKYKAAAELGVEGIIQCWYFGNYPSVMSKAAGELSFADDFTDKNSFLQQLAAIWCGRSHAAEMSRAWNYFEEGYANYPVNIMFSYYGPMHDGVAWELSLLPKNNPLPRSWLLLDKPDGDRIGECLQSGHTLEEAVELTGRMIDKWDKGVDCLPDNLPQEQRNIAEALLILFLSGHNILRFYQLREQLGLCCENPSSVLGRMEELALDEIKNSGEMILLCEKDSRLGYHSEAEGYKFFPEKLKYRIKSLNELLKKEFPQTADRLRKGLPPLDYYLGDAESAYILKYGEICNAKWESFAEDRAGFRMALDTENLYLEVKIKENMEVSVCFEFRLMWPCPEIFLFNGKLRLASTVLSHQSVFGDKIDQELAKYKLETSEEDGVWYRLTISRKKSGWTHDSPIKMRIAVNGTPWKNEHEPTRTLGKIDLSPGEFGWVIKEN